VSLSQSAEIRRLKLTAACATASGPGRGSGAIDLKDFAEPE
jgi:hypothetical protein